MIKKILIVLLALSLSLIIMTGCGGKTKISNLNPQELFKLALEKYNNKKYLPAIELFQTVIYNYAGESVVDSAQFYLAMSYFNNHDYELAGVEFNRLALNYPSSGFFEEAVFLRAASSYESNPGHHGLDQTDLLRSIKFFEDFIIDFPESKRVPDAQAYILQARSKIARKYYESAVVYSRIGALKSSQLYSQIVIDDYTDTEYASLAAFLSGEMEFKMKNYDKAREIFEKFLIVFENHEKANKAKKLIVEAAFRAAERDFQNGKQDDAKLRFNNFIKDFPENGKAKKAAYYLEKMNSNS